MTKKEARKHVLKFVADSIEFDVLERTISLFPPDATEADEKRIKAEAQRLADYLRWNLSGRRDDV